MTPLLLAHQAPARADLGEWGPPAHYWFWVYGGTALALAVLAAVILWSWRSDDLGRGEIAARVALVAGSVVSLGLIGLGVQSVLEPPITEGIRDSSAAVSQALAFGAAGVVLGAATVVGFLLTPAMRDRLAA